MQSSLDDNRLEIISSVILQYIFASWNQILMIIFFILAQEFSDIKGDSWVTTVCYWKLKCIRKLSVNNSLVMTTTPFYPSLALHEEIPAEFSWGSVFDFFLTHWIQAWGIQSIASWGQHSGSLSTHSWASSDGFVCERLKFGSGSKKTSNRQHTSLCSHFVLCCNCKTAVFKIKGILQPGSKRTHFV